MCNNRLRYHKVDRAIGKERDNAFKGRAVHCNYNNYQINYLRKIF